MRNLSSSSKIIPELILLYIWSGISNITSVSLINKLVKRHWSKVILNFVHLSSISFVLSALSKHQNSSLSLIISHNLTMIINWPFPWLVIASGCLMPGFRRGLSRPIFILLIITGMTVLGSSFPIINGPSPKEWLLFSGSMLLGNPIAEFFGLGLKMEMRWLLKWKMESSSFPVQAKVRLKILRRRK